MNFIDLPCGKKVKVSEEDFEMLSEFSWYALPTNYVVTTIGGRKNKKHIYMHRMTLGAKKGEFVDHFNKDPLDNRRENIKITTLSVNNYGRKYKNRSSQFLGVGPVKSGTKKWVSQLFINKKVVRRLFLTEMEAAIDYDIRAIKLLGVHAKTNFLPPCDKLKSIEVM